MGRGSGSGAGRASAGPKLGTRFVPVSALAKVPIEGAGIQQNRVDRQARLIAEGKVNQNVVVVGVSKSGKLSVIDGRHRILAARAAGGSTKLRVRFERTTGK